jgi:hypothetical protein
MVGTNGANFGTGVLSAWMKGFRADIGLVAAGQARSMQRDKPRKSADETPVSYV